MELRWTEQRMPVTQFINTKLLHQVFASSQSVLLQLRSVHGHDVSG